MAEIPICVANTLWLDRSDTIAPSIDTLVKVVASPELKTNWRDVAEYGQNSFWQYYQSHQENNTSSPVMIWTIAFTANTKLQKWLCPSDHKLLSQSLFVVVDVAYILSAQKIMKLYKIMHSHFVFLCYFCYELRSVGEKIHWSRWSWNDDG